MKVLCVCIGNSCRSPMAESLLRHIAAELGASGWHVDSAGIADWNVGRTPEKRALRMLDENGLTSEHVGRVITADDFRTFDYIFGMDDYNIADLKQLAPADATAKIVLLGTFDYGRPEVIADPYFSIGMPGFETAYAQIERSCRNFVKHILGIEGY